MASPSWRERDIESRLIDDDGCIPNNPDYPLIVYRNALDAGRAARAEDAFKSLFARNDWRDAWVDGIYDFHHYHSTAHEVLGIARGWASVQFGGLDGPVVKLGEGDAVLIPAGVGHCRIEADTLSVVGAYPNGQEWDLCRATREDSDNGAAQYPQCDISASRSDIRRRRTPRALVAGARAMLAEVRLSEGAVMRIRRRELRLSVAVLGVCAVALGLVFWMGGASQSSEIAAGGSSEFAKSAQHGQGDGESHAPNQIFPTQSEATPDGSPAELWSSSVSGVEAQAEDEAPAELWADPFVTLDNGATQSGPDELWTEVAARPTDTPGKLKAPSDASFKDMVKARAEEFAGGVDAAGMPLYRFNLWLNAPTDRAAAVVKVAYRFEALSATHTALASADRTQDFRVEFGAASCPKKVDVELTFLDGRTEAHEVDGCAILQ